MKKSQYGACGIYCGACGATDCGGCRSGRVDESVTGCKFRRCTTEKGVEFCCFCGEYPCKELAAFMHDEWPHHWTMEPNLAYIKEHGKQAWLAAQEKQWSCKSCGGQDLLVSEVLPLRPILRRLRATCVIGEMKGRQIAWL